jgi:hypothetical protein
VTRGGAWVVGQFAVAVLLVLSSAVFMVGESRYGWMLGFGTFFVWWVLPGAAFSFVVNALVMRRHGDAGPAGYEKGILVLQAVLLVLAVTLMVASDATAMFVMMYGTPIYVIVAFVMLGAAVERNRELFPRTPTTNAPSTPAGRTP